jgi:hypothetical protein
MTTQNQNQTQTATERLIAENEKVQFSFSQLKDNFNKMAQVSPTRAIDAYSPRIEIEEALAELTQNMVFMLSEATLTAERKQYILERALRSNRKNLVSRLQSNPSRNLASLQATARYIDILTEVLDQD